MSLLVPELRSRRRVKQKDRVKNWMKIGSVRYVKYSRHVERELRSRAWRELGPGLMRLIPKPIIIHLQTFAFSWQVPTSCPHPLSSR